MRTGLTRIILVALLAGLMGYAIPARAATVDVGQHIHTQVANHPRSGFPIPKAKWTFQVTIIRHDWPGRIDYLRVDRGNSSGTTIVHKQSLSLGPCADCSYSLPVTIDFSSWPTGRHELRWHTNGLANGDRQYTTSRSQVCVVSCTPSYRRDPWNGSGTWYTGHDYEVGVLESSEATVKPGGQVKLRVQQGAKGCAFINPDFHNHSHGTQLGSCWTGTSQVTRTIPSSASPGDRFVLYAGDGKSATVFRMTVTNGSLTPTATYEYQSWWAESGIVLP